MITIVGKINEHGKLMIGHDEDFLNFCDRERGKMVVIRLVAVTGKGTELSKWYFSNVIIPQYKNGLQKIGYLYNDEQTLQFIMATCPHWEDEEALQDTVFWNRVVEWCKFSAAAYMDTVITDLKTKNYEQEQTREKSVQPDEAETGEGE